MPGGSRPENGWIVHAPNGVSYQMNASLGYGTPTIPVPVVTAIGVITMGGLANGVTTMLDGSRPTEGSYIIAPNGIIYQMSGGSGVFYDYWETATAKNKNTGSVDSKGGVIPPNPNANTRIVILYDPNMFNFKMNGFTNAYSKILKGIYGAEAEVFESTGMTSATFIKWWNDCLPYELDAFIFIGHGSCQALVLNEIDDEHGELFWMTSVSSLKTKKINMVALLACNTGLKDMSDNIAYRFAKNLESGGTVIAVDGELGYNNFLTRNEIMDGEAFRFWRNRYNEGSTRKPEGLIAYTNTNGIIDRKVIPDSTRMRFATNFIKLANQYCVK